MDIAAWLDGLGLGQYKQAFCNNDIDGEVLRGLTADDLRELGVGSIEHRRRLLDAIARLVDAGLAHEPHRLQRRFYHHRYAAVPMECRGVVSAYDPRTGSATIWSSTQVVHWVRREAA
jgi:CO/xanthine dehydrogenase Mo-binding subunit